MGPSQLSDNRVQSEEVGQKGNYITARTYNVRENSSFQRGKIIYFKVKERLTLIKGNFGYRTIGTKTIIKGIKW